MSEQSLDVISREGRFERWRVDASPVPYPTSLSWTSGRAKAQGSGYLKPSPPLIAGFTRRPRAGKIPGLGLPRPACRKISFRSAIGFALGL